MPISLRCAGCQKQYKIPDQHAGKRFKCQACGTILVAPQGADGLVPLGEDDEESGGIYGVSGQPAAAPTRANPYEVQDDETRLRDLFGRMMHDCRRRLGDPPREFDGEELAYFKIKASLMCWIGLDRLGKQYRDQDALRERGTAVWGHLVQANSVLFDRNAGGDYPADVLYSPDPYYDDKPFLLEEIAGGMFALKGTKPADKELRTFVAHITDELARPLQMRVPKAITGGRPVYMSALYLHRKHMPAGYLAQGLFPVLINLEETPTTMMVPSRYWSEPLLGFWGEE